MTSLRTPEAMSAASERGFTLPELMIVIVLMGILAAIAVPSWFGLIESRNVESATNQLAADLRLANNSATNQVGTNRLVTLSPGRGPETAGADYVLTAGATSQNRTLPGNVRISNPTSPTTLTFKSDGTVNFSGQLKVTSGGKTWQITVIPSTSEVKASRVP